jgi:hypothetical protein
LCKQLEKLQTSVLGTNRELRNKERKAVADMLSNPEALDSESQQLAQKLLTTKKGREQLAEVGIGPKLKSSEA